MRLAFPVLSSFQAREILERAREGEKTFFVSLDLGRSKDKIVVEEKRVIFPEGHSILIRDLEEIAAAEGRCYIVLEDKVYPVSVFSEKTGWVRTLKTTTGGVPTSVVGGFIMHRVKEVDPWQDAEIKVNALISKRGGVVLDTCMGLGYTAILLSQRAQHVITVEVDPSAVKLAQLNPYSAELFESENIEIVESDVLAYVKKVEPNKFSHILHDPPNFRLAGELYSRELYQEFFRVLRYKGVFYHYIGNPKVKQGFTLTKSVKRRLAEVGFSKIRLLPQAFGLLAYKFR